MAATTFTFCAVVAVPARLPVTFPVRVPKKLVAVAAVALRLPEKISVVNTFVPGLNCNVESDETATPEAVALTGLNNK